MKLTIIFRYTVLWLFFVVHQTIQAQNQPVAKYHVKGMIADSIDQKPIEFVTINLLDAATNKSVGATYTNDKGLFELGINKKGEYKLELILVGYHPKAVSLTITDENPIVTIPFIPLTSNVQQLADVVVVGTRQLVEQKSGMLVYHAERDVTNLGGTAADVLRKTPVLKVDADGNVSMRGSSNLKILINGKYSGQMARSPADALNMIPADMIKSVEVITSPSSRYDAEGAAGVINIITKKGTDSLNGALELVASNWEQAFNPRLAFSKGKLNVNFFTHAHRLQQKRETNMMRLSFADNGEPYQLQQQSSINNVMPHGMSEVSVDYQADSTTLISLSATAWLGNWPSDRTQNNTTSQAGNIIQQFQQKTTTNDATNLGYFLSLGYSKKFKRVGQELFLIALYEDNLKDDFDYFTTHTNTEGAPIYMEENSNHMRTRESTLQLDYTHPLSKDGKNQFEVGAKAILRDVTSDYRTFASTENLPRDLMPVANRTNVFEYGQDIIAGYVQTKFNLPNKWFLQAGIRMEQTLIHGRFATQYQPFKNNFQNFVPSATITKILNEANSFNLSYTQRISRPSIIDLNPNIDARDSKNLESGNPDLRPEASHQVELSHTLSTEAGFFFNTSLYGKQTNNSIEDIIVIRNDGASLSTKQNVASNEQYGVNLSTSFSLSKGITLESNARLGYMDFRSVALDVQRQGWGGGLNINTTFKLRGNYTLQAFGDYDSQAVTLQGHETDWFYYSFALKKEWTKSKITAGLSTVNPFNNSMTRSRVIIASGFTSDNLTRYYNRAVKLTLVWKFGGQGKQINRKSAGNDDLKSSGER
ncbi:outer membrane beta-barrel family protein [Emticicia sp. C21]|uniref:outer membrane beta-barrel family protein n=1 Tax=Emticicia sp. C21 TaxID=2302915 RepID=UPI000E343C43|nr:outer membrane beta-barrel family protein [Emticicia sp. C21]RFS17599.1 TonB-dependent receptor [Emticicia sp. C21]